MIKGGYKIVNFNGAALSGVAETLPGIYDQIVDDYDKPIMVSGVILSGELQDDAYASVKGSDGSVDLAAYGGIITVTEDDEVTFAVVKSNTELTAEIGDLDDLETTEKDSVVGAVNEVKNSTSSLIKVLSFTASENTTIAGSGYALITIDTYEIPEGYRPIGINTVGTGSADATLVNFTCENICAIRVQNKSISEISIKPFVTVSFIKSSFVA